MKIRSVLASLAIVTAGAAPAVLATSASAADTVQLRVADSITYSAERSFDHTVCLDGEKLTNISTGDTNGPFDVAPGVHELLIIEDTDAACTGSGFVTDIEVPDIPAATLVIHNLYAGQQEGVTVFPDDISCTASDEGRLVIRNTVGLWTDSGDNLLDVDAIAPDGTDINLTSGLSLTDQDVKDLPQGTYTDLEPTWEQSYDEVPDEDLVLNPSVVTIRTYFGGGDGPTGSYESTIKVPVCGELASTTTTSMPTTTTVAAIDNKTAPVATPVAANPSYTG